MVDFLVLVYFLSILVLCHGLANSEGGDRLETVLIVLIMVTPVLNTIIAVGYIVELFKEMKK